MHRGGPALRGVAPGELGDSFVLLWRFPTGGAVGSSAAVVDGKAYVGSDDKHVYALDLAARRKLWAFRTGGIVEATPLVRDGFVYAASEDGTLYCIDAATGREKWRYRTENDENFGSPNCLRGIP